MEGACYAEGESWQENGKFLNIIIRTVPNFRIQFSNLNLFRMTAGPGVLSLTVGNAPPKHKPSLHHAVPRSIKSLHAQNGVYYKYYQDAKLLDWIKRKENHLSALPRKWVH